MNCLIVDDNRSDRLILRKICESFQFMNVIIDLEEPIQALQMVRNSEIDLIILDVEMPELNGMDFLKIENSPITILVSGKTEYAAQAFDFEVLDYIVKPIEPERMIRALYKAKHKHEQQTVFQAGKHSFFIRDKGILVKICTKDILFCQALGDYISIVTTNRKYTVRLTMKCLESKLPADEFVRVHRSFLVSLEKIDSIEDNLISIAKNHIPISELYRHDFIEKLNLI